jgi:hypothetical protein
MRAIFILSIVLAVSGCSLSSPKPETKVIAVPSSKPYRYIKPHPTEDKLTENTLAQIERHNNVHWQVKEAEKKAAEQK